MWLPETGAYTLIATATVNLFLYRQKSWFNWYTEKERNWGQVRLTRREVAGVLSALALLLMANLVEAFSIVERLA